MQISLRSQLIAGTAAVVGASAIAMTPVVAAPLNLPSLKVPSAAQVALAGFDSPISELIDTVSWINYDLFNGDPANIDDNWSWQPFAGMLPEFIYTALPIVSQMGYNGADYINVTIDAATAAAYGLSEAVWNLPGALITATKQLFTADFAGAIKTLTDATWVPIKDAVSSVVGSGLYIVNNVVTNLTNVLATLPGIAKGLVNATVGIVKASINAVTEITKQTFAALGAKNFELAWNTVVDGLFGPIGADGSYLSSIPGVVESLTIGPGLVPLGPGNGYMPQSFRMWGEQSQLTIANALGATWPAASVAAPKSVAAKASRVAAPVAAVAAAPAAVAAAGDNNAAAAEGNAATVSHPVAGADASAADVSAPAGDSTAVSAGASSAAPKAAAKHGVSRKAAAKAAAAN